MYATRSRKFVPFAYPTPHSFPSQTGLCVYQVDEAGPRYVHIVINSAFLIDTKFSSSSSTEPQDEAYRLQKRVAELESLIREVTFLHTSCGLSTDNKPSSRTNHIHAGRG